MYRCLAVAYHLQFWQNDRGLLCATVVIIRQRSLTLEKKKKEKRKKTKKEKKKRPAGPDLTEPFRS